jgi:NAD(P)-dependent dehydrogenase (short-subunit alcohol dehydrogenase family)
MGTYVISGAASGMGAATAAWLRGQGHEVIGVDVRDVEVQADLSEHQGREEALSEISALSGGRLDGVALFAGLVGLTGRPAHLLASVNYFGSVRLFEGLRPLLAKAGTSFALAACSNSMTVMPNVRQDLVEALLAGDEAHAREVADQQDSLQAYPATKTALARWLRSAAPTADWIGQGIRLNAIAPGMVETPMVAETRADEVLGKFIDAFPVPIGRGGRAEELAELAGFMLTKATFMVGSIVLADGGSEAQLRPDAYPTPWVL